MATHILTRSDNKTYHLNLTEKEAELMLDKIEKGESIRAKGEIFPGKFCKLDKIKAYRDPSALQLTGEDLFRLPGGQQSTGFWFTICKINQERHKDGLPWVYGSLIDHAMRQTNISEPHALVEFIEAEWDTLEADTYNKPKLNPNHEGKKMAREWLRSEEGTGYLMSKGERAYTR